ncbi:hypothetical protein EAL2_c10920 [Peptoclostridium acidaminophilum DSM 3953]|uniref:Uncharacterized protein n=1 Tax=Peptoclostridium acidaminophilum DSM 3953 TaxID=1286171 RepID=W8T677_PEPAC|nr:hypothetical protein [Peptoclostridium acidaminophilum]AHM56390.1 hypothetical protein EAL2_c10920 [Peptoclostridium acidaminophilum DSM 3953]
MRKEVSDLKKALFVLLHDQYDMPDIEIDSDDEDYIDCIISALVEKNGDICPFKNYDCVGRCEANGVGCICGLNIDCDREPEDVWSNFFKIA